VYPAYAARGMLDSRRGPGTHTLNSY